MSQFERTAILRFSTAPSQHDSRWGGLYVYFTYSPDFEYSSHPLYDFLMSPEMMAFHRRFAQAGELDLSFSYPDNWSAYGEMDAHDQTNPYKTRIEVAYLPIMPTTPPERAQAIADEYARLLRGTVMEMASELKVSRSQRGYTYTGSLRELHSPTRIKEFRIRAPFADSPCDYVFSLERLRDANGAEFSAARISPVRVFDSASHLHYSGAGGRPPFLDERWREEAESVYSYWPLGQNWLSAGEAAIRSTLEEMGMRRIFPRRPAAHKKAFLDMFSAFHRGSGDEKWTGLSVYFEHSCRTLHEFLTSPEMMAFHRRFIQADELDITCYRIHAQLDFDGNIVANAFLPVTGALIKTNPHRALEVVAEYAQRLNGVIMEEANAMHPDVRGQNVRRFREFLTPSHVKDFYTHFPFLSNAPADYVFLVQVNEEEGEEGVFGDEELEDAGVLITPACYFEEVGFIQDTGAGGCPPFLDKRWQEEAESAYSYAPLGVGGPHANGATIRAELRRIGMREIFQTEKKVLGTDAELRAARKLRQAEEEERFRKSGGIRTKTYDPETGQYIITDMRELGRKPKR